ncbi:MAG: class II aldolase/adducin family protein [Bacteroidetes bacterium]|nr:class II aldolase/adducin family protein [Bacteroidota bacterium]
MSGSEGIIKFNLEWKEAEILIPEPCFSLLNDCRKRLCGLNLIGETPDGTGYGNVSVKINRKNHFYISGSGTGGTEKSYRHHYALVESYNLAGNSVVCSGLAKASSESLTHAAIYEYNDRAKAVIHVHSPVPWNKYKDRIPTTPRDAEYGTPEMASAIRPMMRIPEVLNRGIIIMGGHEDGILVFGTSLQEAEKRLLKLM